MINLFKFIDWVIGLPKQLDVEYVNEVYKLEVSKMAYISSIERVGMQKGIDQSKRKIAKNLLNQGVKLAVVKKATGLSLTELKKLHPKPEHKKH